MPNSAPNESARAAQIVTRRYHDARSRVLDYGQGDLYEPEVHEQLDTVVDHIAREMLAMCARANEDVKTYRNRLVHILRGEFDATWDAVAEDGYEIDEGIMEAINGAERDILGEYTPVELWQDPGAEMEVAENLGISVESRRAAGIFESRWVCTTCQRTGDWTANIGFRGLHLEHARTHVAVVGS